MIQLEHVKKQYKDFELDCSLEVKSGRITGLVGQNGSGKSTTFKAILGLIRTDSGQINVFGKEPKELTPEEKCEIGTVLAESGFSGYILAKDVSKIMAAMYPKFNKEEFESNCKKYGIPMDKKIKDFSSGMKTKLKMLVAISHEAKLLILDEPTSGVDVVVRDEFLDLLREYMKTEGRSILISSHISSDLETLCDDFYMIHDGKVVLHEEVDVLLSQYGILKPTVEQYAALDKKYVLKAKKEPYGYRCLTNERQFYIENYPEVVVEKGNIDDMILVMVRGGNVCEAC